jgi:hypothetical protein
MYGYSVCCIASWCTKCKYYEGLGVQKMVVVVMESEGQPIAFPFLVARQFGVPASFLRHSFANQYLSNLPTSFTTRWDFFSLIQYRDQCYHQNLDILIASSHATNNVSIFRKNFYLLPYWS